MADCSIVPISTISGWQCPTVRQENIITPLQTEAQRDLETCSSSGRRSKAVMGMEITSTIFPTSYQALPDFLKMAFPNSYGTSGPQLLPVHPSALINSFWCMCLPLERASSLQCPLWKNYSCRSLALISGLFVPCLCYKNSQNRWIMMKGIEKPSQLCTFFCALPGFSLPLSLPPCLSDSVTSQEWEHSGFPHSGSCTAWNCIF